MSFIDEDIESSAQRLVADDRALRKAPLPGPSRASLDVPDEYEEMRALFVELAETMRAIRADPNALRSPFGGGYDVSMIKAMTSMIDTLRKIIEGVNKMKNSDRLVMAILESHTKTMSQNLAIPLGEKVRAAMSLLESGQIDMAHALLSSLLSGDIVSLFRDAASTAMTVSRESFNLH